jgi:hypothetical protein
MKKKVPFLSIILGVVLVVIAVVLPSGSGEDSFIRMAKMLPEELGEFTFIDVEMLQSDEAMSSTWDMLQEQFVGQEIYGENSSKVTGFGLGGSEYGLMLYAGDFNLSLMTLVIEESSVESFQYEGITVWTDMYSYSTAVIGDVVFIGSSEEVQMCIDVAEGEAASLYDNKDVQDVIGRLPGGYMLGIVVMGGDSSAGTYGLLAVGMSAWRQGGNISQMSLLKFEDSDAAQEYVTLIGSEIPEDYDVSQDGQYLTISSTSELPGPEEEAYNSAYANLLDAVVAYYYDHDGELPTINGTVNISGYDSQILDICALLTTAEGGLNDVPEGVASVSDSDNDNCDAGCEGCSAASHYVWAIDDYGIYSTCVGDECDANGEDGFQGVWP